MCIQHPAIPFGSGLGFVLGGAPSEWRSFLNFSKKSSFFSSTKPDGVFESLLVSLSFPPSSSSSSCTILQGETSSYLSQIGHSSSALNTNGQLFTRRGESEGKEETALERTSWLQDLKYIFSVKSFVLNAVGELRNSSRLFSFCRFHMCHLHDWRSRLLCPGLL